MTTQWNAAAHSGCGVAAGELFNVVLVYEDMASAHRGLGLYQRLVNELGGDVAFNLAVWKFTVLGVARLVELSTEQAAAADLVIVCTRDAAAPPEPVQVWFRRWLELKGHTECALVVLDGESHEQSQPVQPGGFFHDLSRYGRVAVFPSATPTHSAGHRNGRTRFTARQIAGARPPREGFSPTATSRAHLEAKPTGSFNHRSL